MARILVTNFHPAGGGGHVPYIHALTQLSGTGNHVVGVAAPAGSRIFGLLRDSAYPHLYPCDFPAKIQKELPGVLGSIRTFRRIVAAFKPDIVHANGAADMFITVWSHPAAPPFQIVRTHHAIRNIPDDPYHRWLYNRKVASNIYVSRSALRLSTSKGLVPANALVIENGVDLDRFHPIPRNAALAREYGLDDERCFCFGSCAGTGPYKRVDTIIEAAVRIRKEGRTPFKILVLGDASSGLVLQESARERGVDEFVYCGSRTDVVPYVSLFDAGFVLSDAIETISFAAREMMAMGKPLMSSSFSGLGENVRHGVNGLLVEPGDVAAVASAMRQFLAMDKETLQRFARSAREFAVDRFGIGRQQSAHALLYDRMTRP